MGEDLELRCFLNCFYRLFFLPCCHNLCITQCLIFLPHFFAADKTQKCRPVAGLVRCYTYTGTSYQVILHFIEDTWQLFGFLNTWSCDSEAEYIEHAEKLRQVKAVLEEVYTSLYLYLINMCVYIYVYKYAYLLCPFK